MDVLNLIDEIEDLIEESSKLPLSNKTMVNSDEILEIIQDIRLALPDEIQQAYNIKEDKERIIKEAEEEATRLITEAEEKSETMVRSAEKEVEEIKIKAKDHVTRMVDEDGLSRAAQEKADNIVNKAKETAKVIQMNALDYTDELLREAQDKLEETVRIMEKNRRELRRD